VRRGSFLISLGLDHNEDPAADPDCLQAVPADVLTHRGLAHAKKVSRIRD
jgi:hypothetical protein